MSFAVGVDVPVSQMPAGMAFDGASGGGIGQSILGGIGKGILSGLDSAVGGGSQGSEGYGSRTPYTDRTRDMLSYLIKEAIASFEPAKATIS
jgi:hypothetical protein